METMESTDKILREMREFADTDSQSIGRDVLRREIQHFADRLDEIEKLKKAGRALERWLSEVAASKSETTTADATVASAKWYILRYVESARCHTEDAHILGYLDQIAKWARSLKVVTSKTETTTEENSVVGNAAERETVDIESRAIYGEARDAAKPPTGNEAKTREALLAIHALLGAYVRHEITVESLCLRTKDAINAALAEPPRNCDRNPTLAAALDAWRDIDPREAGMFDAWLFDEAKGE